MPTSITPEALDRAWFLLQDNRFDRAEQVHRAWFLLQNNRFERAEQVLREYLSEYPDRVCAHTMLATCLFDLSRHSEAIESAKLAIALDPNSYYQYWILGCLYVRLQQIDLAEEYLLKAIERDPKLPYCYALLSELYWYQGASLDLEHKQRTEIFQQGVLVARSGLEIRHYDLKCLLYLIRNLLGLSEKNHLSEAIELGSVSLLR